MTRFSKWASKSDAVNVQLTISCSGDAGSELDFFLRTRADSKKSAAIPAREDVGNGQDFVALSKHRLGGLEM